MKVFFYPEQADKFEISLESKEVTLQEVKKAFEHYPTGILFTQYSNGTSGNRYPPLGISHDKMTDEKLEFWVSDLHRIYDLENVVKDRSPLKNLVCQTFKFGDDKWFDYEDEFVKLWNSALESSADGISGLARKKILSQRL